MTDTSTAQSYRLASLLDSLALDAHHITNSWQQSSGHLGDWYSWVAIRRWNRRRRLHLRSPVGTFKPGFQCTNHSLSSHRHFGTWRLFRRRSRLFSGTRRFSRHLLPPSTMVNVITDELDKVAPLKRCTRRPSKSIMKWLSDEAIAAKRECRRFERKWNATRGESDRVNYHRACRRANRLINKSRRVYFHRRLSDCTDSGQQCRVAKELLHSSDRDLTGTDSENQTLCITFSHFFHNQDQHHQRYH